MTWRGTIEVEPTCDEVVVQFSGLDPELNQIRGASFEPPIVSPYAYGRTHGKLSDRDILRPALV